MSGQMKLEGQNKDLGDGFLVRRLLPHARRQSVGPFVFLDHFGPVRVGPAFSRDSRPHPHIGLATVTYLFEGAVMHRDSLACVQRIEPGAINWMTAGRGIVPSERRPDGLHGKSFVNHGIQLWAALRREHEEDRVCRPTAACGRFDQPRRSWPPNRQFSRSMAKLKLMAKP